VAALDGQVAALASEKESLKASLDGAKEEVTTLKATVASEGTRLDAAVKVRAGLLATASKVGVALKGDESDIEIKKAVIMKLRPHAKLDGATDTYVEARYVGALEDMAVDSEEQQSISDVPNV
jgi:hypothetical protein